jgi:predicted transcriptional regulator
MSVKVRLSVYLDPELMDTLAAYADRRERSRSLVAEAAIASFCRPTLMRPVKRLSPSASISLTGA